MCYTTMCFSGGERMKRLVLIIGLGFMLCVTGLSVHAETDNEKPIINGVQDIILNKGFGKFIGA